MTFKFLPPEEKAVESGTSAQRSVSINHLLLFLTSQLYNSGGLNGF